MCAYGLVISPVRHIASTIVTALTEAIIYIQDPHHVANRLLGVQHTKIQFFCTNIQMIAT